MLHLLDIYEVQIAILRIEAFLIVNFLLNAKQKSVKHDLELPLKIFHSKNENSPKILAMTAASKSLEISIKIDLIKRNNNAVIVSIFTHSKYSEIKSQ